MRKVVRKPVLRLKSVVLIHEVTRFDSTLYPLGDGPYMERRKPFSDLASNT